MTFGPIVPTLNVGSMQQSLAFYREQLGFELRWSWSDENRFDTTDPTFACVGRGEAVLFLAVGGGGQASSLFIELPFTGDVDELARSLSRTRATPIAPEDMPWGSREFRILDPDRHELRFSCPSDRTRPADPSR